MPIYCRSFGQHLFQDPDRFPGRFKYTLQPLLDLGKEALACGDVEGIEWAKLVKVHFLIGGPQNEYVRINRFFSVRVWGTETDGFDVSDFKKRSCSKSSNRDFLFYRRVRGEPGSSKDPNDLKDMYE